MDGLRRKTGIKIIGDIHWGTHWCLFYQTKEDLIDILVPYFKAGLENHEFCIWITSEPLDEKGAIESIRKAAPDFENYLESGQIEIIPHSKWYLKDGTFNLQRVLDAWIDKLNQALAKGYDGMRVTGNTAWLEDKDWRRFTDYEEKVNSIIGKYRMLAICTYSLDKCGASEVIDVVKNHQFAIIRQKGRWEVIESSELKQKRVALSEANVRLQVLQKTIAAVHSTLDLDELFKQITDGAVYSMDYNTALIMVLNEEKKRFEVKSISAKEKLLPQVNKILGYSLKNLSIPADNEVNPFIMSVIKGRLVVTRTLAEVAYPLISKKACQALQKLRRTKNCIVVPLKIGEVVVGAIFCTSPREEVPEEELVMIQNFTVVAAQAISNAELYTQTIQAKKELQQSESKFKNLFEQAKDAIFLADAATGVLIDANSAACSMLGMPKEKIVGMHQSKLHPPELVKQYTQIFQDHIEKGITITEDLIVQRADGSRVPVDISASIIELEGRPIIQGIFRDITERKQVEEDARKKTEDLTLVNLLNDSINRGDSLNKVTQLLSEETKKIFSGFGVTVYLLSEDKEYLVPQNLSIPPRMQSTIEKLIGIKIPSVKIQLKEGSLYSEALKTGTAKLISDPEAIKRYMAEFTDDKRLKKLIPRIFRILGICSMMYIPLVYHGQAIGLVNISRSQPFVETDLNRFSNITKQITNILERKLTEEALRESEERYRAVVEGAHDMIQSVTPNGRIMFANRAWRETLGYSIDELSTLNLSQIIHPDSLPHCQELFSKVISGEAVHNIQVTFLTKDGRSIFVEGNTAPRYVGEEVIATQGIWRDVTERKKMEDALRESRNFNSSLLENSPHGVMVINPDTSIRYVNPAWEELNGWTLEEIIGIKAPYPWWPEETKEEIQARFMEDMKQGSGADEVISQKKNGERYWIAINWTSVIHNGEFQYLLVNLIDITERKRMEEALRESEEKLQRIFESVNDGITVTDLNGIIVDVNEKALQLSRFSSKNELIGRSALESIAAYDRERAIADMQQLAQQGIVGRAEYMLTNADGLEYPAEISANVLEDVNNNLIGFVSMIRDITESKKREQLQNDENHVLTLLGQGVELSEILDAIVQLGEYHDPSIKGSILFFDPTRECLVQASAPSLPDDYTKVLEYGLPVGPNMGSCGTAAYLRERVIVPDIENSPLFKQSEGAVELAVRNGLLSCWSQPIISSNGELLGTIANYSNKVGEPTADNLRVLEWSARIATLAIERKRAEEALFNEATRRRILVDGSRDGIVVLDQDGKVYEANQRFAEMLGYSSEEVLELDVWKWEFLYPPEKVLDMIRTVDETGDHFETQHQRKDGTIYDVEISTNAAFFAGKKLIFCVCRDITERKRMAEALRVEQQNFSNSIDNSPLGIMILGAENKILYCNQAYLDIYGYSDIEEFTIIPPEERFTPESLTKIGERMDMRKAGKPVPSSYEVDIVRKNGEIRNMVVFRREVIWNGEKQFLTIWQDITERKRAEEALEEERQNFRNSIDNSPLGILILTVDSQVVYVNQALLDMSGHSSTEDFMAMPMEKRFTTESLIKFGERREMRKAGKPVPSSYEVDIIRKDGVIRNMTVFHREVIWNGEKQYQTLWQDITERKKAQEQLIVTDRLASVGELAAGVAHELNNPLTSVIGFSQLLLARDVPDDVKEDIKIICSEAQRTAAIVKNLLTFARKHTPVKQMVSINSAIDQVLQLRAYEQRVNDIRVITHFAEDLPDVMADFFQLQQVFLNIIINAEHFMIEANRGGTLTITTKKVGNIIRTSFTDNGPGISREVLGHLFDPFFTTKEVGKGTGLGLSICHGIITEHSGRIYAESELGKGATFIVELPIMTTVQEGAAT